MQPESDSDSGRARKRDSFGFIHQSGSDSAPAELGKHIEILDLGSCRVAKRRIVRPPVDRHITAEFGAHARDQTVSSAGILFGEIALILRSGLVPAERRERGRDLLDVARLKGSNEKHRVSIAQKRTAPGRY